MLLSPDGRQAVSATQDRVIKVWDLENGLERLSIAGAPASVRRLYSGSHSVEERVEITRLLVTPDGRTLVSASTDGVLKIWDLESGRERHSVAAHSGRINALTVLPDGRSAASASDDGSVKIWDLETGHQRHAAISHVGRITTLSLLADGRRALSISDDGEIRISDLEDGHAIGSFWSAGRSPKALLVSDPGRLVVAASAADWSGKAVLEMFDVTTGARIHKIEWSDESQFPIQINDIGLTPDGRSALTATGVDQTDTTVIQDHWTSARHSLKVWDLENGRERFTLAGHDNSVHAIQTFKDGQRALSASWDKTLKVWDLATGRLLHTLAGHTAAITRIALSSDERRALSASADGTIRLWDLETGSELLRCEGHAGGIIAAERTINERHVVSASEDGTMKVWSLTGGSTTEQLDWHLGAVTAVAVNSNRERAATASTGRTLKLWNVETGVCLRTMNAFWTAPGAVYVTADGRSIVANADANIWVWDASGGELLTFLTDRGRMLAIAADGWRVLCRTGNEYVVWDLTTGNDLSRAVADESNAFASHQTAGAWPTSHPSDSGMWVFVIDSRQVAFHAGQASGCSMMGSDGATIVAGGRGGGVFFLHLENSFSSLDRAPSARRRIEGAPFVKCPRCWQWAASEALATAEEAPAQGWCWRCNQPFDLPVFFRASLPLLTATADPARRLVHFKYPTGFWLESGERTWGGYSGHCRVCGTHDSDPGKPPRQCPSCGWPGS